jgi:hypothetical protein
MHLHFSSHARAEMAKDQLPEAAVYHVVGDFDDRVEQDNGRTLLTGVWEGRVVVVILESDGRTVVTAWERKRDTRRRRRRG